MLILKTAAKPNASVSIIMHYTNCLYLHNKCDVSQSMQHR